MHKLASLSAELKSKVQDATSAISDVRQRVAAQMMDSTGMADKDEDDLPELEANVRVHVLTPTALPPPHQQSGPVSARSGLADSQFASAATLALRVLVFRGEHHAPPLRPAGQNRGLPPQAVRPLGQVHARDEPGEHALNALLCSKISEVNRQQTETHTSTQHTHHQRAACFLSEPVNTEPHTPLTQRHADPR